MPSGPVEDTMEAALLRPHEAADYLAISRSKVYELMRAGEIGSVQIGNSRRIPLRELQRYVESLPSSTGGRDGAPGPLADRCHDEHAHARRDRGVHDATRQLGHVLRADQEDQS
ncbi:helix-turn-helix domain-containing protein [Solicola sp. PLA-1-18]|uniref:helix-turn-helix domain-containing protein n=1 Tax=Solicola sp. PLA-1-18 TaxID=3380532 RepID=UPI003B78FC7C